MAWHFLWDVRLAQTSWTHLVPEIAALGEHHNMCRCDQKRLAANSQSDADLGTSIPSHCVIWSQRAMAQNGSRWTSKPFIRREVIRLVRDASARRGRSFRVGDPGGEMVPKIDARVSVGLHPTRKQHYRSAVWLVGCTQRHDDEKAACSLRVLNSTPAGQWLRARAPWLRSCPRRVSRRIHGKLCAPLSNRLNWVTEQQSALVHHHFAL